MSHARAICVAAAVFVEGVSNASENAHVGDKCVDQYSAIRMWANNDNRKSYWARRRHLASDGVLRSGCY